MNRLKDLKVIHGTAFVKLLRHVCMIQVSGACGSVTSCWLPALLIQVSTFFSIVWIPEQSIGQYLTLFKLYVEEV